MAVITWTSAASGNWSIASNWSGGQVPGAGDDAVVNLPGAYLISVSGVTVNSLTLNDAAGAITTTGSVTITAGLSIAAGSLTVAFGTDLTANTLSNQGTIVDNGLLTLTNYDGPSLEKIGGSGALFLEGGLNSAGSTLDLQSLGSLMLGIAGTIQGTLLNFNSVVELDASIPTLGTVTLDKATIGGSPRFNIGSGTTTYIDNGLILTGANGTGPGALTFQAAAGEFGLVQFNGNQTIDNASILGTNGTFDDPGTLTLGNALTFTAGEPLHGSLMLGSSGTIVNLGTVQTEGASGLFIGGKSFSNGGLIQGSPGTTVVEINFLSIRPDSLNNLANGQIATNGGHIEFQNAVTNAGSISADGGGIIFSDGTFDNLANGVIEISAGTITFAAPVTVTNDGTIASNGGSIGISPILTGVGSVMLQGNGVVEVDTATAGSETFDFIGAGTLALDQPTFVPSAIDGFAPDDTIRLGVTATAVSYTSGDLKMQIGGGQTFDLAITGSHTLADFIVNTGSASTTINLACFAEGTRIRTTRGPIPVERLREGDLVVVADSDRALPVVWIGYRTVDCRRHPKPASVWPVRIAAGAFARNMPQRDLYLSPDHAVFVDGVLIPVKYLISGTTIAQVRRHRITYYHVELPCHAVLIAEGLAAESRLPTMDRWAFVNGGGPVALHPDFHSQAWEAQGCAPLVVTGAVLADIRARLDRRAFDRPSLRRA